MKGYQAERNIVQKLERLGWNADRVPTSGAGRTTLPDVFATHKRKRRAIALEVKAYHSKTVTIAADQIRKATAYLLRHHYEDEDRNAGVCVKFLLGQKVKAPIVCKLIPVSDGMDLKKIKGMTVDIADGSDLPELTEPTLSKRSRYIIRVRRKKRAENG